MQSQAHCLVVIVGGGFAALFAIREGGRQIDGSGGLHPRHQKGARLHHQGSRAGAHDLRSADLWRCAGERGPLAPHAGC
jgi:hypothetical protein